MSRLRLLVPAVVAALLVPGLAAPASAAGTGAQRTWHADLARVPDARAAGNGGAGVLVAVLDSWVDAGHRDFEGRVLVGADCTGGSCREGVPAPDDCDHGTHVAGTVASSSYGVAPGARVLPVKVLSYDASEDDCTGTVGGVAAGIRYAVARGARVLNLSLGSLVPGLSSSSSITTAVQEAARAGAVVVFAAGNSSLPLADSYGGSALIVAATGPDGRLATYSQRGAGVTLAAPGGAPPTLSSCSPEDCVTSLFPGGRYAVAAGTSMAAPHVAGIAALLLGQDSGRSRESVIDRLRSTARPVAGGGAGDGLVDATAALAGGAPQPAPPPPAAPAQQAPPARTDPTRPAPVAPAPAAPAPAEAAPAPPVEQPSPLDQPVSAPAVAVDDQAGGATADQPPQAAGSDEPLPTAPPALAVALVLAAGLSTAAAGLRRR